MDRFRSWDHTELAFHVIGSGPPLVCIPGGPGQAAEYLGDLGGLSEHRTLILLDNRGTGASKAPLEAATYRVDRLVEDVEALRVNVGLDRMDLFGHSASGGTCLLYAARYPERLADLVLVDPSLRVVGMKSDLGVDDVLALRAHEPWYDEAFAALHAEAASPQELEHLRWLAAPLLYGRWTRRLASRPERSPLSSRKQPQKGSTTASRRTPRFRNSSRAWRHRYCWWPASTTSGRRARPSANWPHFCALLKWPYCRTPDTSPGSMIRAPSPPP